jgi:hypothetical protein
VSPVKYKLGSYIPEDDILHSDRHGNIKSYIDFSHNGLSPSLSSQTYSDPINLYATPSLPLPGLTTGNSGKFALTGVCCPQLHYVTARISLTYLRCVCLQLYCE